MGADGTVNRVTLNGGITQMQMGSRVCSRSTRGQSRPILVSTFVFLIEGLALCPGWLVLTV